MKVDVSDRTWPDESIRVIFRAQGKVSRSIVVIPEDLVSCWCSACRDSIDISVVASIGLDSRLLANFGATIRQVTRKRISQILT